MQSTRNSGWHTQIESASDIITYADHVHKMQITQELKVRESLADQLRRLVLDYYESNDRTDPRGWREKPINIDRCVRRIDYFLRHLADAGYWLLTIVSRTEDDESACELRIVLPIHHRLIKEGTKEQYRVYLHQRKEQNPL